MKSLLSLWKVLAHDMGERCAVDTTRDINTVARRFEHEGLSFFTITLPAYGKAFESWLDHGQVRLEDVTGFSHSQGLPNFLRGFLRLVFDARSGAIVDDPSIDAILAVRQLCGVFGKLFIQASPERTERAMQGYLQTDKEVAEWESRSAAGLRRYDDGRPTNPEGCDTSFRPASKAEEADSVRFDDFRRVALLVLHRVFNRCNSDIAHGALRPRHGPGSTADKLLGNEKFSASWTWRLEQYFSSDLFLIPNPRYASILDEVDFLTPESELPVRVISVPKTQKTPRIIAAEPVAMQYAQQALARSIVEGIAEDEVLNRFLRLDEQEFNQILAREGSITGDLATLDLSEASDRVSNELVKLLLSYWPSLSGAVQACRSTRARVDLGEKGTYVHDIAKFASMGSALTFPIEAIIFLVIVLLGIERSTGRRLRRSDVLALADKVAVYGDDIIVPVDHVGSVVHELESFGFKVNSQKSFWTGKFRESCGKDYYAGIDVSYVKLRQLWPDDRQDVEQIVALVSFFNQCKDAHYTYTTDWLRKQLLRLLGGYFPRVTRESELLGEWDDVSQDVIRMCPRLHRPLAKGWVIKTHIPVNPLDGERALLKFFLKEGENPLEREHLRRSGRSEAVSIKLRMAAV